MAKAKSQPDLHARLTETKARFERLAMAVVKWETPSGPDETHDARRAREASAYTDWKADIQLVASAAGALFLEALKDVPQALAYDPDHPEIFFPQAVIENLLATGSFTKDPVTMGCHPFRFGPTSRDFAMGPLDHFLCCVVSVSREPAFLARYDERCNREGLPARKARARIQDWASSAYQAVHECRTVTALVPSRETRFCPDLVCELARFCLDSLIEACRPPLSDEMEVDEEAQTVKWRDKVAKFDGDVIWRVWLALWRSRGKPVDIAAMLEHDKLRTNDRIRDVKNMLKKAGMPEIASSIENRRYGSYVLSLPSTP